MAKSVADKLSATENEKDKLLFDQSIKEGRISRYQFVTNWKSTAYSLSAVAPILPKNIRASGKATFPAVSWLIFLIMAILLS